MRTRCWTWVLVVCSLVYSVLTGQLRPTVYSRSIERLRGIDRSLSDRGIAYSTRCVTTSSWLLRKQRLLVIVCNLQSDLWCELDGSRVNSYHDSLSGWANEFWEAAVSFVAVSAFIVDLSGGFVGLLSGRTASPTLFNLVDPASSYMLVSKIKPCMSQYKCFTAKLRMAH